MEDVIIFAALNRDSTSKMKMTLAIAATAAILQWMATSVHAHGSSSPYQQFSQKLFQTGKLDEKRKRHLAAGDDDVDGETTNTKPATTWDPETKEKKICNILGGLDLTRLRSYQTLSLFKDGIEDVELMREVVTESMYNGGLAGGLSNLDELSSTLDTIARGLSPNITSTLSAGLGWVDDRADRRIERQVTTPNQPFVGDKQADATFSDTVSNILPWIRDRRAKERHWYNSHQNGRTEGISKAEIPYDSLYIGVWIVTPGDAIWYYPPMSAFAHPYTFSDIMGGDYSWRVYPAEPLGWPFDHSVRGGNIKDALYDPPYADVAHPGLSMISAMAPVYYTGEWSGYGYNDTFIGAVGVDIALDSIAHVLDDLEDTLTEGSFAMLVDANTFKIVAMSQSVVEKVYPEYTGLEEGRVTYNDVDGSIVEDRRNQTYKVSDTIWQGLLDGLTESSPHWQHLYEQVQATEIGGRGYTKMTLTIRDSMTKTLKPSAEYYAMFDRWDSVAEWAVLVFAPVQAVEHSILPEFSTSQVDLQAIQGEKVAGQVVLTNQGTLDIIVSSQHQKQDRIQLLQKEGQQQTSEIINEEYKVMQWDQGVRLKPGESVPIDFLIDSSSFGVGNHNTPLFFHVEDDDYPDCLHAADIPFQVSLSVSPQPNMNYLGNVRIGGLLLAAISLATALGLTIWTVVFRKHRVVRASQPLFLIMISGGCFIMASAIIPMSIDDEVASQDGCTIACMATPWLASVGFVTTFSALFSKVYRINKIFGASNTFKRIKVTEKDVIKPFCVLFSLNFIVLLCWTLVDPLVWTRLPQGEWDSIGVCRAEGNAYIIFMSLVGFINLVALILASYQAYRAREISDEFSETKYIAIAICAMLQVLLVGLPLLFIVQDNPSAQFFMQAAIIFVISMAVSLLIFVPKMQHVKNYKAIERKRAEETSRVNIRATLSSTVAKNGASTAESDPYTSEQDDGIMIIEHGTAALRKENDELKASAKRLKTLLKQHNIDYHQKEVVQEGEESPQREDGTIAEPKENTVQFHPSHTVLEESGVDDLESPP